MVLQAKLLRNRPAKEVLRPPGVLQLNRAAHAVMRQAEVQWALPAAPLVHRNREANSFAPAKQRLRAHGVSEPSLATHAAVRETQLLRNSPAKEVLRPPGVLQVNRAAHAMIREAEMQWALPATPLFHRGREANSPAPAKQRLRAHGVPEPG